MIKMDMLDYEVYCKGKHIADFDDLNEAKTYAQQLATRWEANAFIINRFTGELVGEFVVKFRTEVVEVEP